MSTKRYPVLNHIITQVYRLYYYELLSKSTHEFLNSQKLNRQAIYPARELFHLIKKRMTEEMFNGCCADCKWKKGMYCSYEKLMTQLAKWTEEDNGL